MKAKLLPTTTIPAYLKTTRMSIINDPRISKTTQDLKSQLAQFRKTSLDLFEDSEEEEYFSEADRDIDSPRPAADKKNH